MENWRLDSQYKHPGYPISAHFAETHIHYSLQMQTFLLLASWNSASKCHTVSINFGVSYLVMYQQASLVTTHKYTLCIISRTIQKKNLKPELNS